MAGAVIAIRGRVGQPRFPRERLRRDVIELELGRPCRQPRWAGVLRESGNGVRDHRIAGGSGRGDHRLPVMSRMTARPLVPTA